MKPGSFIVWRRSIKGVGIGGESAGREKGSEPKPRFYCLALGKGRALGDYLAFRLRGR
jgi:hypothetical protein